MVSLPQTGSAAPKLGTTLDDYMPTTIDGRLRFPDWAIDEGFKRSLKSDEMELESAQYLRVEAGVKPVRMKGVGDETALPLVSNGDLGVDLIRVAAGTGFEPHTHPGDHLLIVVAGMGTITYKGYVYPTHAGQVYMIAGDEPHAVGAITDHAILAVGSPHIPAGSPDRMKPKEYVEVAAKFGNLTCLICGTRAKHPAMLHDEGCPHCPCANCASGDNPNRK